VTQESNNERQRQTFAVPFKLRSLEAQEAADLLLRLADGDPMSAIKAISEHYSKRCSGRFLDAAGLLKRVLACVVSERQSLKVKRDVAHSETLANRTRPWTCKPEASTQATLDMRPQTAKASVEVRPVAGNAPQSTVRRAVMGARSAHTKQRNACNQVKGRPVSAPMSHASAHGSRPQGAAPPSSSTYSRPADLAARNASSERYHSPWCVDARTGLPGLEGQAYSTTTHASKATAQAGDGDAAKVESLVAQSHKPKLDRCWKDSNVQVQAWFKERQEKHRHQKNSQTRVHIREMEWLNSVVQRQVDRTQRIRQEEREREAKLRKEQEAAEERRSLEMRRMISGNTVASQPLQEASSPHQSNTYSWTQPPNTEGTAETKSSGRVGKTSARSTPSTSMKRIQHTSQDGMVINESSSTPGGDAVTKTSKVHSDSTSQQCIPEHQLSDESNRVDKRTDCPSQNVGGRVGKKVTIRAWPEDDSTDRTENDAKDNNGSTFFLTQTSDA